MLPKFTINLLESVKEIYNKLGKTKSIILVIIWIFVPVQIGMTVLLAFILYVLYKTVKKR